MNRPLLFKYGASKEELREDELCAPVSYYAFSQEINVHMEYLFGRHSCEKHSGGKIMTSMEALIKEATDVPEPLLDEILDFLRFLKSRYNIQAQTERAETMVLSESALAKDWLRPEEDEAWRDL